MAKLRISINGAAGRMGQRLVVLAANDRSLELVAALESTAHPRLGTDAGMIAGVEKLGVPLSADFTAPVDVAIDFSQPLGTAHILNVCLQRRVPLVVATTGLGPELQEQLRQASQTIPILWSPSMSLAVNLTMQLAETAGRALKQLAPDADVEIIERHHRFKEDAPSGTALLFGQILADAMGLTRHQHGREGRLGPRHSGEIGYHAVRAGDNPGEHTVIFGMMGETIELTVRASNRDAYALGALSAARFLAGKPPGMYGMRDVLQLD